MRRRSGNARKWVGEKLFPEAFTEEPDLSARTMLVLKTPIPYENNSGGFVGPDLGSVTVAPVADGFESSGSEDLQTVSPKSPSIQTPNIAVVIPVCRWARVSNPKLSPGTFSEVPEASPESSLQPSRESSSQLWAGFSSQPSPDCSQDRLPELPGQPSPEAFSD